MFWKSWRHKFFNRKPRLDANRVRSGRSTCPMTVEILENRLVPAVLYPNILVGKLHGSNGYTPNFSDGAISVNYFDIKIGATNYSVAPNLRSAVALAGQESVSTTIDLDTGTYKLTSKDGGELTPNGSANLLVITNRVGAMSTIDAQNQSRHFELYDGTSLTLNDLLLINGNGTTGKGPEPTDGLGGSILIDPGADLTLTKDILTNNNATGASGQDAQGGAIYYGGQYFDVGTAAAQNVEPASVVLDGLTIENTVIAHNTATGGSQADGYGGGLYSPGPGSINITNSTFAYNKAQGGSDGGNAYGGAIAEGGGTGDFAYNTSSIIPNTPVRITELGSNNLNITNSTFAYNKAQGGSDGGNAYGGAIAEAGSFGDFSGNVTAILTYTSLGSANLYILNSTFTNNQAVGGSDGGNAYGGAIAEGGGIGYFSGNTSQILAYVPVDSANVGSANLDIANSTFAYNKAQGGSDGGNAYGGGIAEGGELGEFSGNTTMIVNPVSLGNANLDIVNSTFAYNQAEGGSHGGNAFGGGIAEGGGAVDFSGNVSAALVNDTIAFNQANGGNNGGMPYGGGVYNALDDAMIVLNTIIAKNTGKVGSGASSPNDVYGVFDDLGHNLIGATDDSSGFTQSSDFTGTAAHPFNPGFAPAGLAYNGGPTETIAILSTSKAVDGGDDSVLVTNLDPFSTLGLPALTTDQRGFARDVGAHVDIGAYEYAPTKKVPGCR